MLLLVLAGLTKIQFLMAGSVWVIWLFANDKYVLSKKEKFAISVFGVTVAGIVIEWYIYARKLIDSTGMRDVGLVFKPSNDFNTAIKTITDNLVSDLPELLIGYASFVFLLIGIYISIKRRKLFAAVSRPYVLWGVLFIVYYLIELGQMKEHNYYLIIVIPLLVLIITFGAGHLYSKSMVLFFTLLIVQPLLSAIRIVPSRWIGDSTELPDELYKKDSRNRLQQAIPAKSLCIIEGDVSGCIWFYFLEKKGYNLADKEIMLQSVDNKTKIEKAIEKGVRYLYTNDDSLENDERFKNLIVKKIMQEGSIKVYQLKSAS